MTAQAAEKIIIDGEEFMLLCEPLERYLGNKKFDVPNTACWRGYIGTWELKDKELHLIDFYGKVKGQEVDLNFLFPNASSVKADWFTGTLRIPMGEMIHYVHGGFASVYSDEMFIEIEHGNAVKTTVKHNEYKESYYEENLPF